MKQATPRPNKVVTVIQTLRLIKIPGDLTLEPRPRSEQIRGSQAIICIMFTNQNKCSIRSAPNYLTTSRYLDTASATLTT